MVRVAEDSGTRAAAAAISGHGMKNRRAEDSAAMLTGSITTARVRDRAALMQATPNHRLTGKATAARSIRHPVLHVARDSERIAAEDFDSLVILIFRIIFFPACIGTQPAKQIAGHELLRRFLHMRGLSAAFFVQIDRGKSSLEFIEAIFLKREAI